VNRDDARRIVCESLRVIAPEADLTALDDDMSLRDELDLDSMDFLNFVVGIHDRSGVEVPERDYPQLVTLGGCVDYLTRAATAAS
jgi:acyl carrier protein